MNNTPKTRDDVLRLLNEAKFPKGAKASGAKIMLGQVIGVSSALCGVDFGNDTVGAVKAMLADLATQCEVATFGIIRDNPVDIAISLGFANFSGVWHLADEKTWEWSDAEIAQVAKSALGVLPRVRNEIKLLKVLQKEVPEIIWFDYDFCAAKDFRVTEDILARAKLNDLHIGERVEGKHPVHDTGMFNKIVHAKDHHRVLIELGLA